MIRQGTFLFLVLITSNLLAQSKKIGEPDFRLFGQLIQEDCRKELLPPEIQAEPVYTKGDSNTIFYELSEITFPEDQILGAAIIMRVWTGDGLECLFPDTVRGYITIPDPRGGTSECSESLKNGIQYLYAVQAYVSVSSPSSEDPIIYCSDFSDSVFSIQDTAAPVVSAEPDFSSLSCINLSSFLIPFSAIDSLSGAVDSATLYYRNTPGAEWTAFATKKVDEMQSVVVDSILFNAPRDGYYEFYIGAKDTAWAADNSGRAGNEDIPNATSPPLYTLHVDMQTPTSSVQVIDEVQTSLCFNIPFTVEDLEKDGYKSGLENVVLFCQYEDEPAAPCDTLTFSCVENSVAAEFNFQATKDGRYQFFTRAIDCCGNVQSEMNSVETRVQATPSILSVVPERNDFMHANEVDSIVIVFDRKVCPADSWRSSVTIINRYANNETVPFTPRPSDTECTDRLTLIPGRVDSTGLFEISINSVLSSDTCQAVAAIPDTFNFYTYMEQGKGGTILKPDLTLRVVEPGQPLQDVVFIFEPGPRGCESRDGYRPITDSEITITARMDSVGGDTLSGIFGSLCLNYGSSNNLSPGSLRIYREIEGHCMPAGNSRNWSFLEQSVCADSISDVTGFFSLYGQDRDSLDRAGISLRNYPNPFGEGESVTTITYTLNRTTVNSIASNGRVALRIFDVFGNLVKTFPAPPANEGENACPWDGRNDRGQKVANGGYIAVLELGGRKEMRKIAVRW